MPDLERSKYFEINIDIEKIDDHGKDLVLALYNKVFKPCFQLDDEFYDKITTLAQNTGLTLRQVKNYEPFLQREATEKAHKYFLAQVNEVVANSLKRSTGAGNFHKGGMLGTYNKLK